ncbi:hypothetical protein [Mucilaginibacter ginkgonis]|uniref:Uncharacterized protein n=1 Tax=Mucilaginibacter ginkgonis TaxID=2682091 RepID=A0A6I4HWA9_9SPHI|nr:hypothetical protein [Mucilaginibacter ginkgonis]QQL50130.1 hypothetical protein GO620_001380 [Mucilaginibacter ginkgonis]
METAEKKAAAVQGTAGANGSTNKTANRPSLTGTEAKQTGNEKDHAKAKDQSPAATAQSGAGKDSTTAAGSSAGVVNQPLNGQSQSAGQVAADKQPEAGQANAADNKADIKYIRPVFGLEQTLKSVESLHRLSIQRLALIARIKTLEDFEVKLVEEGDELSSNPYHGCKLIIKDDKGREFVTNTPNLIRMVSQYIFDACNDKLAEIEAHIVFPNA